MRNDERNESLRLLLSANHASAFHTVHHIHRRILKDRKKRKREREGGRERKERRERKRSHARDEHE